MDLAIALLADMAISTGSIVGQALRIEAGLVFYDLRLDQWRRNFVFSRSKGILINFGHQPLVSELDTFLLGHDPVGLVSFFLQMKELAHL